MCMAGMGQSCNYVVAAELKQKSLTNALCTSTANQWLRNYKDAQPMKVKDMKFGREDFCQQGKKKRPLCRHQRRNIIPLVNKGI